MGAAYLLPRVVGQRRALELLLLGDTIDAVTAERYGLVNRVVPHDELLPTAQALRSSAGRWAATGQRHDQAHGQQRVEHGSGLSHRVGSPGASAADDGQDHRIFYEAFLEKAKPRFSGR